MNKINYLVYFLDANFYHPLGSRYTVIIRDLKTVKGVKNRITKTYHIPERAKNYRILKVINSNIYNDDNLINMGTFLI